MKNQALFSLKDKSKKLKCRLLQFLFGALRVKFQILTKAKLLPGIFIRPFEKRSYYVIPLVRPSVHPSVCKLFHFRVTPPTVYILS